MFLPYPAECILVTCHLYPYRIDSIVLKQTEVHHNESIVMVDCNSVRGKIDEQFLRLLSEERKRVGCHYEVIVLCVVMFIVESVVNAVSLLFLVTQGVWISGTHVT